MQTFALRRDRFALFDNMDSPALNLCFPLDLPDFRPWCKEQGLAPFHVTLCAVLRAIRKIDNFNYRMLDGEVIRIDRLMPAFTVTNMHDDVNFANFEWTDDLREFVARGQAARAEAESMETLNPYYAALSGRAAKEQVFVTCIPWLEFTSIQHPTATLSNPDIPSLAWGRFRSMPGARLQLPFSVQAHHGFVDGLHVARFAQQIGREIEAMMQSA